MDISIHGCCMVEDRLWFSIKRGNGLCCMDLDTGEIKYVTSIPGESMSGRFLYGDIKNFGHQLILIPGNAKEIAVYDMDTEKIVKIPIFTDHLKYRDGYNGFGKFHSAFIFDGWIYFVPRRFPAIVKMDLRTFEVRYLQDWIKAILPYRCMDRAFFRKDVVSDDKGMLYLTSLYYNMVLSVDTRLDQTVIVRNGCVGDECGCSCIAYQNNRFVLSEMGHQKIAIFDFHWKLMQRLELSNRISEKYRLDYIRSVLWENYIFYIPFGADRMLRLDMDTSCLDVVRQWDLDKIPRYEQAWLCQEKLYCYGGSYIDIYDIEGRLTDHVLINFPEDLENDLLTKLFISESIVTETQVIQIGVFLKFLSQGTLQSNAVDYSPYGDNIYEEILDLLMRRSYNGP